MNNSEIEIYNNQILTCPLFKDMFREDLPDILSSEDAKVIRCEPGDSLESGLLYIVLAGTIVIEKQASDGRFVTMGTAKSGAAINAASVFLSNEAMSRLIPRESSLLLQLNRDLLDRALRNGGKFAVNMAEFLAGRISFLNKKITSLAGYSAGSRLQLYLQEHSRNGCVEIPMSLTEFAEYLGVGRASLYRTLDQMESSGVISRRGRLITIKGSIA